MTTPAAEGGPLPPLTEAQRQLREAVAEWLYAAFDAMMIRVEAALRKSDLRDRQPGRALARAMLGSDWTKVDAQDAADAITVWTSPDLAALLQTNVALTPLAGAFVGGANQASLDIRLAWKHVNQRALDYAKARAAEMVGMRRLASGVLVQNPAARWRIDTGTRDKLRGLVVDMIEQGASYRTLRDKIEALPQFAGIAGETRAESIARTESAIASNQGASARYGAAGVTHVLVHDNPACPVCAPFADTTQTLAWSHDNPVGHPACIRAFSAAAFASPTGPSA